MQALTNYSQAKYAYLDDIVALRLAAGNLDPNTIKQINSWLAEPPPPAPENTSAPSATAAPVTAPAPASATTPAPAPPAAAPPPPTR